MAISSKELTERLKSGADELGFSLVGVCPAVEPPGWTRFAEWLAAGYAGEMHYLANRRHAYAHPRHVLDGVQSLLMLALRYGGGQSVEAAASEGRVARYAWGSADYHDLVHDRLKELCSLLLEAAPTAAVRGVVDTAPLLEREYAQLAGLGWIGKNTLLLNRELGSYFFLAALLTDQVLEYDAPHQADHCGTCRACLDACPTEAFPRPYVLDASRCISYLTIEHRSSISPELRERIGDWWFGCDICQEVCPWNQPEPPADTAELAPRHDLNPARMAELFTLDDDEFRRRYRLTPLWRAKRRGLLRNAALVLGNRPSPEALTALCRGLCDVEPLVRGAAAWALGRYDEPGAQAALAARRSIETDQEVRQEIEAALTALGGN